MSFLHQLTIWSYLQLFNVLYAEQTCVSLLDDAKPNFNTSQSIGILASAQVFFPDIIFNCNGVITQIQTWFQVRNGPDIIVNASLQFQVWMSVDSPNSAYELVSEVTVPSAVDEGVITVDNLRLPFYEGSIASVYILKPDEILTNFSINASAASDTVFGYYHFTDKRLCVANIFDADIRASLFSPEVALLYGESFVSVLVLH